MKPASSPNPHPASSPPLEVPDDLPAVYVNVARISHSPAELLMDFAHLVPGTPAAQVKTRLVMSPIGAKLFYLALGENLARYEASFGAINTPGNSPLANELFGSINPPEHPTKG